MKNQFCKKKVLCSSEMTLLWSNWRDPRVAIERQFYKLLFAFSTIKIRSVKKNCRCFCFEKRADMFFEIGIEKRTYLLTKGVIFATKKSVEQYDSSQVFLIFCNIEVIVPTWGWIEYLLTTTCMLCIIFK